jgi:hypothetical protein
MGYSADYTTIRASTKNAAWLVDMRKDGETVDDVLTRLRERDC